MRSVTGRVVRVNLTNRRIDYEQPDVYKQFIGGRGVGSYILMREVPADAHPYSPENIITLNTGPLTGTLSPASGRISISTKNAATGGVTFANAGGFFGPEMRYAGFDHIIIQGASDEPVYLFLHDGEVDIRPAHHIWGQDTWDTETIIRNELGEEKVRVAAIGQAGENLVNMACIMFDRSRAAGWGGCGAVMGSKKLKAIAVRGTGSVAAALPDEFMRANKRIWDRMRSTTTIRRFNEHGNLGVSGAGGIFGTVSQSVRNMEDEVWSSQQTMKVREIMFREQYQTRRLACFTCPIQCSRFYHLQEGAFAGHKIEGLKTNVFRAFGPNIDLADRSYILIANEMADRYGMNCDSLSAAVAWAIEVYQKGLIDTSVTGGLQLQWGDGAMLLKLLEMIAHRQGFGDLLAEGVHKASMTVGRGTEQYAMHVKGHGICEQGMRSFKGWSLGIITSTKGGGHLSGAPNTEQRRVDPETAERLFGVPTAGDPTTYAGKGKLVAWFDAYKTITDMSGVCVFATQWLDNEFLGPDDFAELISAVLDEEISGDMLMHIGEQVFNIEKAFNTIHAGMTRKDDMPPQKLTSIPISGGEFAGELLRIPEWNKMLDEYYCSHGWDPESGLQTRQCLEDLGLEDVAENIESAALFPNLEGGSDG